MMDNYNQFGRRCSDPNMQNMPGTPAHAAEWAIERGEDPYMAAYVRLLEMIAEDKKENNND